ncbi:MAG: hypothetical protein EPN72_12345 [Nevskiaceae bacterium]|nr:MAG: hypothetical protein EPN63_00630 [Nevskiaceae bacterium]TBR71964.1 MAG: hypothetical protein EPN72_12345 [Nevskiaceae bacterium]
MINDDVDALVGGAIGVGQAPELVAADQIGGYEKSMRHAALGIEASTKGWRSPVDTAFRRRQQTARLASRYSQ